MLFRTKRFEPISEIIKRVAEKGGWENYFICARLKKKWDKITGINIAQHSKPLKIVFNKLFVAVDQPIWASQLNLVKSKLIEELNKFIGKDLIKDIYFKVKNR